MPRTTYPRDRFDDVADETGRVGAHRAENPRMRAGVVFAWAALATVILVAVGIFGVLVVSDRISFGPGDTSTSAPDPGVVPEIDTTYAVLVLNASGQDGAAAPLREEIIAAGWAADDVTAGDAGSTFETTTVFYASEADEAAALGLADVVGGAQVAQSDQYAQFDDPDTDGDESRVLTVVWGADRVADPAPEG
jgi:hypothetical protein